jgi:hypothetical protein
MPYNNKIAFLSIICCFSSLVFNTNAFLFPSSPLSKPILHNKQSLMPRFNDEKGERFEGTKLVWDEKLGRFFENKTALEKAYEDVCRDEFCAVDPDTGKPVPLSLQEKERIFLEAIQSYYFNGRTLINDEEFNKLKEDLLWEGSNVANLNRRETLFMNAMIAYKQGTEIMSDEEFDALKLELKEAGSPIAVAAEPQCFVDTGICVSTFERDIFREAVLYTPATLISFLLYIGLADALTPLGNVNPIITILVTSPIVYLTAQFLTKNFYFRDPLIATGPCPNCSTENRVFFGDILGVEGPDDVAENKCGNCGTVSMVQRSTLRCRTIPPDPSADNLTQLEKAKLASIEGAKN